MKLFIFKQIAAYAVEGKLKSADFKVFDEAAKEIIDLEDEVSKYP